MYNCEIYSVRKNRSDYAEFENSFEYTTAILRENEIDVRYKTDISADAGKLAHALNESVNNEDVEVIVFVNALNTSDGSSFKRLFYEYIVQAESKLTPDAEHAGMTPKLKIFSMGDMGMGYRGYCFKSGSKLIISLPFASLTQKTPTQLIIEGIDAAQKTISRNFVNYPMGIAYLEDSKAAAADKSASDAADEKTKKGKKKKKKKENFFMSFIPHRGDSTGSKVRKVIVLLAIAAFIGALWYVINFFIIGPMKNNKINAEIRNIAYSDQGDDAPTTPDGKLLHEQNWDALKDVNEEIVGWIRLDDSKIDYPVMFHEGDDQTSQYYLNHTYKHDWSEYGTVFIDYRSTKSTDSKNVILHGHNMIDGSMFHTLINYSDRFEGDFDYYEDHNILTFNTPKEDAKWKIISVFKTSTLYAHGEFFNYMQGEFTSDAEFMNFVYNVRIRSMFNIPVTVNENDQLLTLSTCSYEYTNFRTVVVARKVRPGEDPDVDTDLASVNDDPFLPEVCYSGKRPDPGTFKSAFKKGQINWYDGKYNGKNDNTLKGAEDLTATILANPTEPPTEKPKRGGATEAPANKKVFTVTYVDHNGDQFAAYSVFEGEEVPTPNGDPSYEDEFFYYKFKGWDTKTLTDAGVDMKHLNASLTIWPIFDPVRK